MASMLSSPPARNMLRVAIARAIREARPPSIAFAAPLPITSRTPFPARRRLAVIDRTKGSTESVGLGGERRTGAGSAKDSELEEPDACGVGGDLEAGPCRLDQGETVRIALADRAEKTMRFEIGSGQLTDLAGGHKERAADIASLPLHPVGLGRVENVVAIADLHARIRVAFQQVRARRLQIPQTTASAIPTTTFSTTAVSLGTSSSACPGKSSPSEQEREPIGHDQRDLVLADHPPVPSPVLHAPQEGRDDFNMRRMAELIDRLDPRYLIAAGA